MEWTAFGKKKHALKGLLSIFLKVKVSVRNVSSLITYGYETVILIKIKNLVVRVTQRTMDRAMLGSTTRNIVSNKIEGLNGRYHRKYCTI